MLYSIYVLSTAQTVSINVDNLPLYLLFYLSAVSFNVSSFEIKRLSNASIESFKTFCEGNEKRIRISKKNHHINIHVFIYLLF